jgi:hypothetical protein
MLEKLGVASVTLAGSLDEGMRKMIYLFRKNLKARSLILS